jgi:hypothetical protein
MEIAGIDSALALTTAMNAAADSGDWEAVAALAEQRHGCLERALAGDAWRVQTDVVALLRGILDTDRQLAQRASQARAETATALRDLRGGRRMQGAYAAQAAAG